MIKFTYFEKQMTKLIKISK